MKIAAAMRENGGRNVKEFMIAALPWICIGIAVALFAVNHSLSQKAKDSGEEYDNYMGIGMCIGLCVGTALGSHGTAFGMLIGMTIGMCIRKEK